MRAALDGGSGPEQAGAVARRGWLERLSRRGTAIRLGSLIATFLIWEWIGRGVDPLFFSHPTAIAAILPEMLTSGELMKAAATSARSLFIGFPLAMVTAVVLGLLMGRYRWFHHLLDLQVTAVYATPYTALIPLFILWFGLGLKAKIAIVFLPAFFPIVINTTDGVRNVGKTLIEIAKVERANEWQVFTKIVMPAALPSIMTGIRLGVGRAVVGMVVGEMFTAMTGLGGAVVYYSNQFRTDKMLVVVIFLSLMATILTSGARFVEQRVAAWKETERAA